MNDIAPQQIKRLLIIGSVILAVGIIGYVMYVGWTNRDKTATIEIQSRVPDDATVAINGNKVGSNSKNGVIPGKYTIVAKRNGFEDKTEEVEAKKGETKVVRLLMSPNSEEGYKWMRNHPDRAREYEAMKGAEYSKKVEAGTNANPLISHLPEVHPTWRIDYGKSVQNPDDPTAAAIIITTAGSDMAKQQALDWIKSQGFNPADYEIIYETPPAPGD
jgi:hypothetical protein